MSAHNYNDDDELDNVPLGDRGEGPSSADGAPGYPDSLVFNVVTQLEAGAHFSMMFTSMNPAADLGLQHIVREFQGKYQRIAGYKLASKEETEEQQQILGDIGSVLSMLSQPQGARMARVVNDEQPNTWVWVFTYCGTRVGTITVERYNATSL